MKSLKDVMTGSSDEFVNDDIPDAEEFSPAIEQQGSGVHMLPLQLPEDDFKARWNKESDLPTADYIRKEEMTIRDVAKRYIVPFLPAKALMKFRAVSNEWNNWIASPLVSYQQTASFQKLSGYFYQSVDVDYQSYPNFLSLDHSSSGVPSPSLDFLPEGVKVLSSSSGLLLCQGQEKYYVCNPVTADWKIIPRQQNYHGSDSAAILAFDPQGNIECYFHIVAAVQPLDLSPIVFFEIYCSQSNSWRLSSSDCLELEDAIVTGGGFYMKGMAYWNTTSDKVLVFNVKNEIPAVLHLPIQPGRFGALTEIEDELSYVTAYNECGDVFIVDIYGGMDMSLKRSECVNLGHKKSCRALEKNPVVDNGTVLCRVLPCINSGDDMVVICTTERIYLYHLIGQRVETLMTPGQLNPQRRFIPYTNSLAMLHELKD